MIQQLCIPVADASEVGAARRAAATMSTHAHLGETAAGRVAIIATELATNLVRYAKQGILIMRADACLPQTKGSVEILALDAGPGMDAGRCVQDGYSTGGTPGNGLGAVQRLASEFDLFSSSPGGTVIMARVHDTGRTLAGTDLYRWGHICLPNRGETVSGDSFRCWQDHGKAALMIADGLGHGPEAAAASGAAAVVFENDPWGAAEAFIESSHRAMSGSRGAAVAVAQLDLKHSVLYYAGVGNVAGTLLSGQDRRGLPSLNGIVGAILPKVKRFEYPLPPSGLLVMHSDGLLSRWSLDAYTGLMHRHPALVAAVLYRDFYRGRDDVTILVAGWQGGAS